MGNRTRMPPKRTLRTRSKENKEILNLQDKKRAFEIRRKTGMFERRWNVTKSKWEHHKIDQADLDYYEKAKNMEEKEMLELSEKEHARDMKKHCVGPQFKNDITESELKEMLKID